MLPSLVPSSGTRSSTKPSWASRNASMLSESSISALSLADMGTSIVKVLDGADGGGVLRVVAGSLSQPVSQRSCLDTFKGQQYVSSHILERRLLVRGPVLKIHSRFDKEHLARCNDRVSRWGPREYGGPTGSARFLPSADRSCIVGCTLDLGDPASLAGILDAWPCGG